MMGNEYIQYRPDWTIVGYPIDGGVQVIASRDLIEGELATSDYIGIYRDEYFPMTYTLTLEMRKFMIVSSQSYEEALVTLFGQWKPNDEPMAISG